MPSFLPEGASLPQRFSRNKNSGFRQYKRNRLCSVDAIDPVNGVIEATEVETGRKYEAKIDPERRQGQFKRGGSGKEDRWQGNRIDKLMAESIPVGGRVVLENCLTVKVIKRGDQEVRQIHTDWVSNITDPSPEKSFTGIVTAAKWDDRVVSFQVWDNKRINPATEEGEKLIDELGEEMDRVMKEYQDGQYPIGYGVQFDTLIRDGVREDGTPQYRTINRSPPFDFISPVHDGDKVVQEGHPLDRSHLENYLMAYIDYVHGKENPGPDDPKGLIADGVVPPDADFHVEVRTYRAYSAAPKSDSMILRPNSRSPLARLTNVVTRLSPDVDDAMIGKNWGVYGILVLTRDKPGRTPDEPWERRNMVSRAFVPFGGRAVDSMIRASDGGFVKVDPSIDRVPEPGQEKPSNESAAPAPSTETPTLQQPQEAFDDDDGGANLFAQQLQGTPEDDSASEPEQPAPAPAPATPVPSPAPAAPAPAPQSGGSRFGRRPGGQQ